MSTNGPRLPDPSDQPYQDPYRRIEDTAVFPTPVPGTAEVVPLVGSVPVYTPSAPTAQPVTYGSSYQPVLHYSRPAVGGGHVAAAWIVTVLTLGYMLPWAIAATRGRSNTLAIALVNLLVGWTFIGWVAALVMACMSDPPAANVSTFVQVNAAPAAPPPPGWYPDGSGAQRYWDGRAWTGSTSP